MPAVGSMLSAATRSGFIAATATASDRQAAATFKLLNGQLVPMDTVTTSAKAPAGDPEEGRDADTVEPDAVIINLEMQEWKRLARIMDRLFFWMTLTALISITVVLCCLHMWQE